MSGLDLGDSVIVGACVPSNMTNNLMFSNTVLTEGGTPLFKTACSLAELQEDNDLQLYFDEEKHIIYRKFTETRERQEGDFGDCAGGLQDGTRGCQYLRIDLRKALDFIDLNDGNCF